MKTSLALVIVLCFACCANAQTALLAQTDCNCLIVPYKPEGCFKKCVGDILEIASPNEMKLILGLDEKVVEKISFQKSNKASGFSSLTESLNTEERNLLLDKFSIINKTQNEYFLKEQKDRNKLKKEIENLKF